MLRQFVRAAGTRRRSAQRSIWVLRLFSLPILLAFILVTPADGLTCAQVVARIRTLDTQLKAASGCETEPAKSRPIPQPQPPVTPPSEGSCVPNASAIHAWHQAHDAELKSLTAQLGKCNDSACPAIPAIVPCDCSKGTPAGACGCELVEDNDGDGIPDRFEAALIARFSPFLRFTRTFIQDANNRYIPVPEQFRPADPAWYVTHSRLVGNTIDPTVIPQAVLASDASAILRATLIGSPPDLLSGFVPDPSFSSCVSNSPKSAYHLDPVDDEAHEGPDWFTVLSTKHVGLFAHVSRFKPGSVEDLPARCPRTINGTNNPVIKPSWYEGFDRSPRGRTPRCSDCYKIEYYQFFGMNNDFAFAGIGNHEGDWSVLTIVYDKTTDKALAVSHWAHGYEMRFDLRADQVTCTQTKAAIVGDQLTCTGENNQWTSFNILKISGGAEQDEPEKAQNNEVSFAKDPVTGDFSHPVVFVEYGAHEFWPSAKWGAVGAPAHDGDDPSTSYLSANIPNLGEVEHPLGDEAKLILGYNGSWGYVNSLNDPPPGPALHKAWNWFAPLRKPIACSAAE
jgi:hypothetical protein